MSTLKDLLFEMEWFFYWLIGRTPEIQTDGKINMPTTSINTINLSTLKTKQACYDACEAGQITFPEMRARCDEIEHAEAIAAYSVKIGSTGRFYVSGPACSQSLTAGQILGILSVREKIQDLARRHVNAKTRLKKMTTSKGEGYNQWFQGDISLTSESCTAKPDGILQSIAELR